MENAQIGFSVTDDIIYQDFINDESGIRYLKSVVLGYSTNHHKFEPHIFKCRYEEICPKFIYFFNKLNN